MQNSTLKMMIAGGAVLVSANAAQAWIPFVGVPAEKASFAQLKDIYKQGAKFTACTVKATVSCESKFGTTVFAQDCVMATKTAPVLAGTSFSDALGACEGKVDYLKKSATGDQFADYQGMRCPGDSDSSLAGIQPYANLLAWENNHNATYTQLDALSLLVGILGSVNNRDMPTVAKDIGELSKYAQSLYKCFGSCEGDTKGNKGLGGTTDSATQCATTSADPVQAACVAAAKVKMESKLGMNGGIYSGIVITINGALDTAMNASFNSTAGCEAP